MQVAVKIASFFVVIPLVLMLAGFGFLGLLGAFYMTAACWGLAIGVVGSAIKARPDEDGAILSPGQRFHLLMVAAAVVLLIGIIESPGTDSAYYRPAYYGLIGLPFLFATPFIQRRLSERE